MGNAKYPHWLQAVPGRQCRSPHLGVPASGPGLFRNIEIRTRTRSSENVLLRRTSSLLILIYRKRLLIAFLIVM
jgi:hypothetical protein